MKRRNYWFGLAVSLLFIYFFFRKIDLQEVWGAFRSVNYLYTLPIMLVNILSIWLRAVRWRILLRPVKKIGLPELFQATAIGFMANNLFPARIGELVRAFLLAEKEKISKSTSMATVVVERLFDGFAVLLLFLVVILFMPFPEQGAQVLTPHRIKTVGWLSLLFYSLALVVLVLLRFHNQHLNRIIGFFLKPLPARIASAYSGTDSILCLRVGNSTAGKRHPNGQTVFPDSVADAQSPGLPVIRGLPFSTHAGPGPIY